MSGSPTNGSSTVGQNGHTPINGVEAVAAVAAMPPTLDAVIVGAGFGGLFTLYKLREAGFTARVFETGSNLGGVWHWNRYSGCRNDVEAPMYEFSFKEAWEDWNWTERFPCQQELEDYFLFVDEKVQFRKDICFNSRITAARWQESKKIWVIYSGTDVLACARFFIPCVGYASVKHVPHLNGLESFRGPCHHTSEWPAEIDLVKKRVGIIGTGASGLQVVEEISSDVAQLVVFQRTPNLALPMCQKTLDIDEQERSKVDYPSRFKMSENTFTGLGYTFRDRLTFQDTPEERLEFFESLWKAGGSYFWLGNYKDCLHDKAANLEAYRFWRDKVRGRIEDASLREKLAPTEPPHAFGTKRPSLEQTYFECFNMPHVSLVDLSEDAIEEIGPTGIKTASTFHELDVLILATGFDFVTGGLLAMDVRGIDDLSLREKWAKGIWTNLGMQTAGFPNMFFPIGPQAPTAFGIGPKMAELQATWVVQCMEHLRANGQTVIQTTEAAERAWKDQVNEHCERSLISETDSWYMNKNIAGRNKESLCYTGGLPLYLEQCRKVAKLGYVGFKLS